MNFFKQFFTKPQVELVEGGIYVTKRDEGTYPYRVHKILRVDENIVSIMLYRNCFKDFPKNLDISQLTIAMPTTKEEVEKFLSDDSDITIGVGCMPIEKQGYLAGNPTFIIKTELQDWERGLISSSPSYNL